MVYAKFSGLNYVDVKESHERKLLGEGMQRQPKQTALQVNETTLSRVVSIGRLLLRLDTELVLPSRITWLIALYRYVTKGPLDLY